MDVPDDVVDSYIAQGWQPHGAPKPKLDDLTIKQLRTLASQHEIDLDKSKRKSEISASRRAHGTSSAQSSSRLGSGKTPPRTCDT